MGLGRPPEGAEDSVAFDQLYFSLLTQLSIHPPHTPAQTSIQHLSPVLRNYHNVVFAFPSQMRQAFPFVYAGSPFRRPHRVFQRGGSSRTRRIARSSSGHAAKGGGFIGGLIECDVPAFGRAPYPDESLRRAVGQRTQNHDTCPNGAFLCRPKGAPIHPPQHTSAPSPLSSWRLDKTNLHGRIARTST